MKYMCGKITERILPIMLFVLFTVSCEVSAETQSIEFKLTSQECGSEVITATSGEAFLKASADGVNAEKIKWDSDPERLFPRMQGKNLVSGWQKGGYWMIEFSGTDKRNIRFSADMYSTKKGPRDFELQYSTDGTEFRTIANSNVMLDNDPMTAYSEFVLPSSIEGAEKIYLKIIMCSDISVGGGKITGVKDGSTYINNIVILYDGEEGSTPTPVEPPAADTEKKIYYKPRENSEMQRLHKETGKYKITFNIDMNCY